MKNKLITLKVKHTESMILDPSNREREEVRQAYMEDFRLTINVMNELANAGNDARSHGVASKVGIFTENEKKGALIVMDMYAYLDKNKKDWSMIKIARGIENIAKL